MNSAAIGRYMALDRRGVGSFRFKVHPLAVIGVPASRCSATTGNATLGAVPVISAISCAYTTISRRKRCGSAFEQTGNHEQGGTSLASRCTWTRSPVERVAVEVRGGVRLDAGRLGHTVG